MNPSSSHGPETDAIEQQAAAWVLRLDRGLTAAEQDEYSQWLAGDQRRGEAVALHRWGWDELDRLAGLQATVHAIPDPDLLSPGRSSCIKAGGKPLASRVIRYSQFALAAAAVLAVGWFIRGNRELVPAETPALHLVAPIAQRVLEDGSVIELNRGALVAVEFTDHERKVRLVRGEANFTVAKNPARPFIVMASGVAVRAIGTAFNVRLGVDQVDVIVTEGKVGVAPGGPNGPAQPDLSPLHLVANQRTILPLDAGALPAGDPVVANLSSAEMAEQLAWLPQLLDFDSTPLGRIVDKFNRHNPVELAVEDPALAAMTLSASFRSDNVEGFIRLMESNFGMKAEWVGAKKIVLRKAR